MALSGKPPRPPMPRPASWPYRTDPPNRYWGAYHVYQARGGLVRIEEDIRGFMAQGANNGDAGRFFFFSLAFDQLTKEGVVGDIAELGAYKGHTAVLLADMARRMGTTAWILDTFEGFDKADIAGVDAHQQVQFQDTSLEAVRALAGEDNVRYVKGYFPATASELPPENRYALVHIDCDLYTPITHALQYFYPRMLPGGYLIVHDYASLAWAGAELAVDEFFADKPEAVIPLPDHGGSVAIRKARAGGIASSWLLAKRRALVSPDWVTAANGLLGDLLGEGWSGPESWGVWGIGEAHTIDLYLNQIPEHGILVGVRCAAFIPAARPVQTIVVVAAGTVLTEWHFSEGSNYGERVCAISANLIETGSEGPVTRLTFRPSSAVPANILMPDTKDDRALGLALMGLRVAPSAESK